MALPDFTMRQLLEAGVHFGHQSHRWNPKMAPFIFGARNNIHIIDLAQTVPLLHQALKAVSDTVAKGGRVLLVGTKRQAADQIADAARKSYVDAVQSFRDDYRRTCVQAGVDYVPLDTGMQFDKALMEYLVSRRNRF